MIRITSVFLMLFCSTCFHLQAQSDSLRTGSPSKGIMIGVNGTSFVKNFLSFNDLNTTGTSPFQFTFRKISAKQNAFRLNLGIAASNQTQNEDDDEDQFNFYSLNLSPGYEKRNQISKRWLIYGGVDLIVSYSSTENKNISGATTVTTKSSSMGGGIAPLAGIQFNITDRLSLSTESQLRITYTLSESSSQNPVNTPSQSKSESKVVSVSSLLPGFVYVNVTF